MNKFQKKIISDAVFFNNTLDIGWRRAKILARKQNKKTISKQDFLEIESLMNFKKRFLKSKKKVR